MKWVGRGLVCALAAHFCTASVALADETRSVTIDMMDAICIGSRLDRGAVASLSQMFGTSSGYKVGRMKDQFTKMIAPENKDGWGLKKDNKALFVLYGERQNGDFISRSCSIAVQEKFQVVSNLVETKYTVKKMKDLKQGNATVALYLVELVGMGNHEYAMSIQGDSVQDNMVIFSLFELQ